MSTDIIQLIRRPRHDHEQTDFPTIAFRSVRGPATDRAVPASRDHAAPDRNEMR